MNQEDLLKYIDWPLVMRQPRNSGGHNEIMENIFKDSEVVAWWIQDDYSGTEIYVYKVNTDEGPVFVAINDSFGSCSGCDAWEDCSDEDARQAIHELGRQTPNYI